MSAQSCVGHPWGSLRTEDLKRPFIHNVGRHPDPYQEFREEVQPFVVVLRTRKKTCLVTNVARISRYVLVMTEVQRVMDFSVSDDCFRKTTALVAESRALGTQSDCLRPPLITLKEGTRVSRCTSREAPHRSTYTTDCRRNGESPDRQLVDFCLFPDIHAQPLVCDDIVDVDHGLQDTFCLTGCCCRHHASPRKCRCQWKLRSAQWRGTELGQF